MPIIDYICINVAEFPVVKYSTLVPLWQLIDYP